MRHILLFLLLALGASACAPKPQLKASVALGPLGPCPASSWKPEAPPPTASKKTSMVLLAVAEWSRFGSQTLYFSKDRAKPQVGRLGLQEGDAFASERVHDYWLSVDRPELSGTNHEVPWSAAFISWDIQSAGVPRDQFCPNSRHTIYVERMVDRTRAPDAAFIPRLLDQYKPRVGDLICASRAGGTTTLDNLDRGPGHCDIVVEVRPGEVQAIGGNVEDSVSRSVFPLDGSGFLTPISGRPFFTVIENRLP